MDPRTIMFLLVCLVIIVIYSRSGGNQENYENHEKTDEGFEEVVPPTIKYQPRKKPHYPKKHRMRERVFEAVQFHNDYRDVITALNDIASDRKQVFNIYNEPVEHKKAGSDKIKKLLNDFIGYMNQHMKTSISDTRHPNSGWDDAAPDPRGKDGWDEYWSRLGVGQIYTNPLPRSSIKITEIEDADVYGIRNEVKLVVRCVIKKEYADDELVITIAFVLPDAKNTPDDVKIEEAYVEGVYVNNPGLRGVTEYNTYGTNYREFDERMEENDLTNPREVDQQVRAYYDRLEENRATRHTNSPMFEMDSPIKARELPELGSYGSFAMTQMACDDLYEPVVYE